MDHCHGSDGYNFSICVKTFLTAEQTHHRIRPLLRPATDLNGLDAVSFICSRCRICRHLTGSREASEVTVSHAVIPTSYQRCFAAIRCIAPKNPSL